METLRPAKGLTGPAGVTLENWGWRVLPSPHCHLSCPLQESGSKCFFGDRCRFLHDLQLYLESKPADLGPHCVLFETFGRCPYGVTCRFAGAHLGPNGQNLVREAAAAPPMRNGLDKALQQQLRKRKVRFERAEQALRQLSQGALPRPALSPEGDRSEAAPEQDGRDAAVPASGETGTDTSTAPGGPLRTHGPLTDEDIIRVRPCEKKRVRTASSPPGQGRGKNGNSAAPVSVPLWGRGSREKGFLGAGVPGLGF